MKYLILSILFSFYAFSNECIQTLAAFDIGSGTTKMKVAKVNTCEQKIIEMLLEKDLEVGYKADLKASSDNKLSNEILDKGANTLITLKNLAQEFNPKSYKAVATSAFRSAVNGNFAKNLLQSKTNIDIRIINQKEEARLGFAAASDLIDASLSDIVVWDIGGGSMQISTLKDDKELEVYLGKVASVSFKDHIIEQVQYNSLTDTKTPNPISPVDYNLARRDAFAIASLTTSRVLRDKLKKPETVVIGIGGVHHYSIASNISTNNMYTRDELTQRIANQLGKTDEQIGGEYASTDVSNLILVKGFMDALGIELVNTGNINLATGLLISNQ